MNKSVFSGWKLPAALIFLSFVPVIGGALRLTELAGGPAIMPEGARFIETPLPVVLHIISVSIYCWVGAFQFMPKLRHTSPTWHRNSGWMLVIFGLIAALSGLWMSQFSALPDSDGTLLYIFRLIFGLGMAASILLGVRAVIRGDISSHRLWMMRGYAIGLGAGTQGFLLMPWFLAFGAPGLTTRALLMAAGWGLNLAVVEYLARQNPNTAPDSMRAGPAKVLL